MDKAEMVSLAKKAIYKRWDFEQLKYGDDLYGKEHLADDVWELVEECEAIGTLAFNAKYPEETAQAPSDQRVAMKE